MRKLTDDEYAGASYAKAGEAKSDPHYNRDIREQARDVANVANEVASVQIHGGRDPHIEVRLNNRHNNPTLIKTARTMGKLFEAPVINADAASGPSFKQPPAHTHFKDDRRDR